MIFLNEQEKKIKELYTRLSDLKEGKRVVENAMHRTFYNKTLYHQLFEKLEKINNQIKITKEQLQKEKDAYEKSRKNV